MNYHHAKDAYLNIVVGDVYDAKFTSNPIAWMKKNYKSNYSINRVFDCDVYLRERSGLESFCKDTKDQGLWRPSETMLQNNILYTNILIAKKESFLMRQLQRKIPGHLFL